MARIIWSPSGFPASADLSFARQPNDIMVGGRVEERADQTFPLHAEKVLAIHEAACRHLGPGNFGFFICTLFRGAPLLSSGFGMLGIVVPGEMECVMSNWSYVFRGGLNPTVKAFGDKLRQRMLPVPFSLTPELDRLVKDLHASEEFKFRKRNGHI